MMRKAFCTITSMIAAILSTGTFASASMPLYQSHINESSRGIDARACDNGDVTRCVGIGVQDTFARDGSYSYTYLSVSEYGTAGIRYFTCAVPIGPQVRGGGLADATVLGEFSIDLDAQGCGSFGYPAGSVVTVSFRISDFTINTSQQSNRKETGPNYQSTSSCKSETRFAPRVVTGFINGVPFPQQETEGLFQINDCTGMSKTS